MGLKALNGMKKLWQGRDKETNFRVLRACIFLIATYACEAWVLGRQTRKESQHLKTNTTKDFESLSGRSYISNQ